MITLQLVIVFGAAMLSYGSECGGKTPPAEMDLSSINIPQSYRVSGVISDWVKKIAVAFDEFVNSDRISTLLSNQSGTSLQWLTIKADKNVFLYNKTTGYCDKANSSCLESFPQLLRVSKNLSSVATLLEGLVDFSKANKGFKRGHKIVAGVKGVHWVSCVKDTDGSDNLQVEAVFTDENPPKPPSSGFKNPLVLFLQVGVYGNFSVDDTLKSQLSVEFDSYSSISEADIRHFMIPSGVVCNGWKEEPIPLNASDPYNVHIQIVDEKKSLFESTAYYSASEGLIAVSGARKDDVVPFINEKNVPKGVVSVVHDFNSGYEYGLDSSRCVSFSVLPTESDDVVVSNGTYSMRPLAQILIPSQLSFGNYGALKAENGRTLTIYRGLNNKANVTVEVHFDGDQLDSYTTYKTTDGSLSILSFTKFTPTPDGGVSSLSEKLRACFAVHDRNPNDTFTLAVKSKSIKDVYDKGVDKVTSALAESLSKVGPINPLRVRVFFDTGSGDSLRVFLSLVEKANVKPAIVPKYNYTAEVLSSEFVEKLNKTISQGDWKFLVPNFGNNPEEWVVVGKSFERYIPSSTASTPGYVGYTGGAMFVLGVFTLVLGVAIGAGGVFFVTRRQRISTLAYQVFE